MTDSVKSLISRYDEYTNSLQTHAMPLLLLFCRLWVAWVFFNSGLIKIASWDSTLYLFEFEYQVPLLPWEFAAYSGTFAELVLPVFFSAWIIYSPYGCHVVCIQHYRCPVLPTTVGERFP